MINKTQLFDVNFLIALAWPNHIHHEAARYWFKTNKSKGWATCPITQSAFIRISSNPKIIEEAVTPTEALNLLQQYTRQGSHVFFHDTVDFASQADIPISLFHGHRQVTDLYLLLLAQHNDSVLVTFDGKLVNTTHGTELASYVVLALQ